MGMIEEESNDGRGILPEDGAEIFEEFKHRECLVHPGSLIFCSRCASLYFRQRIRVIFGVHQPRPCEPRR